MCPVVQVDRDSSFYCGDAAGREQGWTAGRKKDFSCSDRLLAINLGLAFNTPEETFLGHKATAKFAMPEFDPRTIRKDTPLLEPSSAKLASDKQEVSKKHLGKEQALN
jgi:bifunctional polynucleotide phosphatase/kinase